MQIIIILFVHALQFWPFPKSKTVNERTLKVGMGDCSSPVLKRRDRGPHPNFLRPENYSCAANEIHKYIQSEHFADQG